MARVGIPSLRGVVPLCVATKVSVTRTRLSWRTSSRPAKDGEFLTMFCMSVMMLLWLVFWPFGLLLFPGLSEFRLQWWRSRRDIRENSKLLACMQ
jgi:hypothetical protein